MGKTLNSILSKSKQSKYVDSDTPKFANATIKSDDLNPDQRKFGDRCPVGYMKKEILGKGGYTIVWHAEDSDGVQVAMKQFPKINGVSHTSIEVELEFQKTLFTPLLDHSGLKMVSRLLDHV